MTPYNFIKLYGEMASVFKAEEGKNYKDVIFRFSATGRRVKSTLAGFANTLHFEIQLYKAVRCHLIYLFNFQTIYLPTSLKSFRFLINIILYNQNHILLFFNFHPSNFPFYKKRIIIKLIYSQIISTNSNNPTSTS